MILNVLFKIFNCQKFEEEYYVYTYFRVKSGNHELAISMTKWVLKETGVLRIKSVSHHIVGQNNSLTPSEYTIMNNVVSLRNILNLG